MMSLEVTLNNRSDGNVNKVLFASEIVPVIGLGINSFFGCLLNLTAGLAYFRKDKAFQNPGNLFTVSLLAGDLAFCGIVIPLIIAVETMDPSSYPTSKYNMYLITRCVVLFASAFSAIGNTLLAFDRFDLTRRPSYRFFRPKGTLLVILISWLISALCLTVPLLSSTHSSGKPFNQTLKLKVDDIINNVENGSRLEMQLAYNSNHSGINCFGICNKRLSSFVYPASEIQVYVQLTLYALATLTMSIIYFEILHSLQKRTYGQGAQEKLNRALTANQKINSCLRRICCCVNPSDNNETKIILQPNKAGHDNELPPVDTVPKDESPVNKKKLLVQETTHLCAGVTKETHKLSKVETKVYDSCNKTDFATVAFSVKAFVMLKKAVRERRKLKQKKLRQLRRMSIAISVAFALSWLPFQLFSVITLQEGFSTELETFCKIVTCSNYTLPIETNVIASSESRESDETFLNIVYLWCLVFASFSPITDALLYTFSRENIRRELLKSYRRITKTNNGLDKNVNGLKKKSLRLLTKTTDFMTPNLSRKNNNKFIDENYASPGSPSSLAVPTVSWRKAAKLVRLKDPDSPSAPKAYYAHLNGEQSIASCVSSNKSTLETSFVSTKSTNNSLD